MSRRVTSGLWVQVKANDAFPVPSDLAEDALKGGQPLLPLLEYCDVRLPSLLSIDEGGHIDLSEPFLTELFQRQVLLLKIVLKVSKILLYVNIAAVLIEYLL